MGIFPVLHPASGFWSAFCFPFSVCGGELGEQREERRGEKRGGEGGVRRVRGGDGCDLPRTKIPRGAEGVRGTALEQCVSIRSESAKTRGSTVARQEKRGADGADGADGAHGSRRAGQREAANTVAKMRRNRRM